MHLSLPCTLAKRLLDEMIRRLGSGQFPNWSVLYIYKITKLRFTMDFRPREALFFGDNFFKLVTICFKFSHHPFQLQHRCPSIWSLHKISKFRVPVIDP